MLVREPTRGSAATEHADVRPYVACSARTPEKGIEALHNAASSIFMNSLYSARMVRFALLRPIIRLAPVITSNYTG